jgi:hypothetical protein
MSGLIIYLFFPLLPIVTDIFFGGDILAFGPPSVQASHHFFGRAPVLTLKMSPLSILCLDGVVSAMVFVVLVLLVGLLAVLVL